VGTRVSLEEGWARLIVVDNGTGIEPAKLADIFKPFVSTKGARGTGLGLAVSRKILREHGGDIVVQSQPGKMSKFTLRLPIKSPLSSEASASDPEFQLPPPKARHPLRPISRPTTRRFRFDCPAGRQRGDKSGATFDPATFLI
jgi:hypothetical protein